MNPLCFSCLIDLEGGAYTEVNGTKRYFCSCACIDKYSKERNNNG